MYNYIHQATIRPTVTVYTLELHPISIFIICIITSSTMY